MIIVLRIWIQKMSWDKKSVLYLECTFKNYSPALLTEQLAELELVWILKHLLNHPVLLTEKKNSSYTFLFVHCILCFFSLSNPATHICAIIFLRAGFCLWQILEIFSLCATSLGNVISAETRPWRDFTFVTPPIAHGLSQRASIYYAVPQALLF